MMVIMVKSGGLTEHVLEFDGGSDEAVEGDDPVPVSVAKNQSSECFVA